VRHARLVAVVHPDEAALVGRHAGTVEAETLRVARPAGGEQHRVDVDHATAA
jgi:hypothetical protein